MYEFEETGMPYCGDEVDDMVELLCAGEDARDDIRYKARAKRRAEQRMRMEAHGAPLVYLMLICFRGIKDERRKAAVRSRLKAKMKTITRRELERESNKWSAVMGGGRKHSAQADVAELLHIAGIGVLR